jgi:hypothetical protein
MEAMQAPLLEVAVNNSGIRYLKKLSVQTNWMFILGIVVYALTVAHSLLYIARVDPERYRAFPAYYIELRYNIVWVVIGSVLALVQLYLYRRFARHSLRTVDLADNEAFNETFRDLCLANKLAIASMFMYMLVSFLHVWIDVEFYGAVHRGH